MGTVHAKELDSINEGRIGYDLGDVKAKVDKIHIEGLGRTKDDLVVKIVEELFDASNFGDVILRSHAIKQRLESVQCFKNVGIFIDTSQDGDTGPDALEVTFIVQELRRLAGGVNTLVGDNEGSVVIGSRLPNVFGRGEQIQGEFSYGTQRSSNINVSITKPLANKWNANLLSALYTNTSQFLMSGFGFVEQGALAEITFESAPKVKHSLRWEGIWRELTNLGSLTAFDVREDMGHSLKSAVKHSLIVDDRDDPILPSRGVLFNFTQQLAGLGGDIGFMKNEFNLQTNLTLPYIDSVLQLAVGGGFMHAVMKKKYTIADRLFLGGPLGLRGFTIRGAGPHVDGNSLGADTFWQSALHFYSPLPFIPKKATSLTDHIRLHGFVNFGNIGNFQFSDDLQQNARLLLENIRIAYGAGLVLRFGRVARIELNYCIPVSSQHGDKVVHGFQFGVGVEFL